MSEYYILLRPTTKKELDGGWRAGYLMKYPLLDGLELVNDLQDPHAYQKVGDRRNNFTIVGFKAEIGI